MYSRFCFFFFQEEEGIRDLVRSRGLGDVYKRQVFRVRLGDRPRLRLPYHSTSIGTPGQRLVLRGIQNIIVCRRDTRDAKRAREVEELAPARLHLHPVSYTHLTLPTSDLV